LFAPACTYVVLFWLLSAIEGLGFKAAFGGEQLAAAGNKPLPPATSSSALKNGFSVSTSNLNGTETAPSLAIPSSVVAAVPPSVSSGIEQQPKARLFQSKSTKAINKADASALTRPQSTTALDQLQDTSLTKSKEKIKKKDKDKDYKDKSYKTPVEAGVRQIESNPVLTTSDSSVKPAISRNTGLSFSTVNLHQVGCS
jgi:hypothetical protein